MSKYQIVRTYHMEFELESTTDAQWASDNEALVAESLAGFVDVDDVPSHLYGGTNIEDGEAVDFVAEEAAYFGSLKATWKVIDASVIDEEVIKS